jgi:hypothetical protein
LFVILASMIAPFVGDCKPSRLAVRLLAPPSATSFLLRGIFFWMAWQFPFFQRETEVNSR